MHAMYKAILLLSLLVLSTGCAHETRTYDIRVRNETQRPVTLVLEKEGGPREDAWTTPEDVANGPARENNAWGLGVVPAGKTAAAKRVSGQFDPGARAWLRVYGGDLSVGEMIKIKSGSPSRKDVPIQPGDNEFTVISKGATIDVQTVLPK